MLPHLIDQFDSDHVTIAMIGSGKTCCNKTHISFKYCRYPARKNNTWIILTCCWCTIPIYFLLVLYGVTQLVGIFVAGFIDICGCRSLCIGGALFGAISFCTAAFLPNNVALFMIVYAIFGGIGHGTITIVSIIICTKYFSNKRALAVGISRYVN